MLRTHTCGELGKKETGKSVKLCGWMASRRDHGRLIFIDLRDRYGLTQIVFDPKVKDAFSAAEKLRREDVVCVEGKVVARKKGMENPKLKTGAIEVEISKIDVLNKAETPPIEVEDRVEAGEEMRLKYRYLDLRRPVMQNRLLTRHKAVAAAREFFNKNGFVEMTTPLLVKSTPEGARDYIVPSRVNPGKFYALPQSPQLYKQILMVAGFDRYYQTAVCLRDEDLRADRQPEHMQWDLEMSFCTSGDVKEFVEGLYKHIFKEVLNVKLDKFPVFNYKEAMERYGTDKPDIRFGLELIDVTETVKKSDFQVFKDAEKVACLNPEKEMGRKELDNYIDFCQKNRAKGMAWMRVTEKGLEGSIVKFFKPEIQKEILNATKAKKGSVLMFIADKKKTAESILGSLRIKLRDDLKLVKDGEFKLCWVKDFPLFAWNEDEDRWEPEHHMFTMPKPEFIKDFEKKPGEVIGDLWDLVLNGIELGSGSMRITNPELQERIMKFIGMTKEQANAKFGFLLEAYRYGAPPHGGMGLGIDRTAALMCGINDIREVIAFPKNKAAECLMDGCPSEVEDKHLKELHIKTEVRKK
jgi:aspartyl-tRNA synthetase